MAGFRGGAEQDYDEYDKECSDYLESLDVPPDTAEPLPASMWSLGGKEFSMFDSRDKLIALLIWARVQHFVKFTETNETMLALRVKLDLCLGTIIPCTCEEGIMSALITLWALDPAYAAESKYLDYIDTIFLHNGHNPIRVPDGIYIQLGRIDRSFSLSRSFSDQFNKSNKFRVWLVTPCAAAHYKITPTTYRALTPEKFAQIIRSNHLELLALIVIELGCNRLNTSLMSQMFVKWLAPAGCELVNAMDDTKKEQIIEYLHELLYSHDDEHALFVSAVEMAMYYGFSSVLM